MSKKGLLSKTHGGAVSSIQKLYYYNENVIKNLQEKEIIANKAVTLLKDGMTIIISDGTTNLAFARRIPKNLKATVCTYCFPIVMELTEHPYIEIIFLGGKVEKKGMVALGLDVIDKFSKIHADICFLGTGSISPLDGVTEGSYDVALIKMAIVAASDKIVSLATSDKLGLRQNYTVCKAAEITTLITELNLPNEKLLHYAEAGIQLL